MKRILAILLALGIATPVLAQRVITINVDVSKQVGAFPPIWAWVGHDEPNYVYSDEGQHLLTELSKLSPYPVHDRVHNLLTTGDGTPSLKWGSTNAFTRDASGKPVYNWDIIDKIFDTYKRTGVVPLVEIGFMPEALSTHPEPYRHHWPQTFDTGWTYPPRNYDEWSDLIHALVQHMADRYGAPEVSTWKWEVWNEPDIFYWHGSPDDYFKLYDYTVDAVKRALPNAQVGGPASTGPANPKAAEFLRRFLEHCIDGPNYVTGKKGTPLDFISFHAKGRARFVDNRQELNIGANLRDVDQGFALIESIPAVRQLPVLLTESDPESCAACDATSHPENGYRLTSQYAAYQAELLNGTRELARRHHINLEGSITWAFAFPGQPFFAGFRALATHNIDLPVLNLFRMLGKMTREEVATESDGAVALDDVLQSSVRANPDINAVATADRHRVNVLAWNYEDNAGGAPPADIRVQIRGLPKGVSQVLLKHWRIDPDHSNAFSAWTSTGSPQTPPEKQLQALRTAGQLQLLESPRRVSVKDGVITLTFAEPRQGISLLDLTW